MGPVRGAATLLVDANRCVIKLGVGTLDRAALVRA